MKPSPIETQFARALILWPARRTLNIGISSDALPREDFAAYARRSPFIRNHLTRWTPAISDDDIEAGIRRYMKRRPWLDQWYADVLAADHIAIHWSDAQPTLDSFGASAWLKLLGFLDEDALLCFDFAHKRIDLESDRLQDHLRHWRTIARCSDFDLDRITSRGLSDLHVHAGGVRLQQSVWLQLMDVDDAWRRFDALRHAYEEDLEAAEPLRPNQQKPWDPSLRFAALEARRHRKTLLQLLGLPVRPREHPQTSGRHWIGWSPTALLNERTLMAKAWREVLDTRPFSLYSTLDAYLAAKHRFTRLCRQPVFEPNVGLKFFNDRYFRRLEAKTDKQPLRAFAKFRQSHRFTMEPIANACAFLAESHPMRRVELRIAPLPRARDYWRFFSLWNRFCEEQLGHWVKATRSEPMSVGFAVHFKRTASRQRRDGQFSAPRNELLLRELDRATAELRLALSCPRNGQKLDALRRVDVAGNERDAVSATFGIHLPLLRGDPEAHKALDNTRKEHQLPWAPYLEHWRRAQRLGRARPSPVDRRLGLTVHAGEDFADHLEGLYQIGGAVFSCGMVAGDGIGHGLALAQSAKTRGQTCPPSAITTVAHALGALCWLYDLSEKSPGSDRDEMRHLSQQIESLVHVAFKFDVAPPVDAVVTAWRLTFEPHKRLPNSPYFKAAREILARVQGRGEAASQLDQTVYLDRQERLQGLIELARQRLCNEIVRRRIVVEMNPSSNARISGAQNSAQSPTAEILGMIANGLIATVNTDNPGVFATCIENEYAALMDSARQAGMPEGQIRDLLERARQYGVERVYWRE